MNSELTITQAGLVLCNVCGKLIRVKTARESACPRCGTKVYARIPDSISQTWALVTTAFLLLIPANILPIGNVIHFGKGKPDTIISGVLSLIHEGMIPIAILVFVASIIVPLFKLIGISILLLAIQFKWKLNTFQCTMMYRFITIIGRWSMLDLFMLSILVALVDMGAVATVTPGPGATAFASVVVITVFAAKRFDPRLLWDLKENINGTRQSA